MTTILTILSLMWLSWIVTLLLVMRFLPQDAPCFNGFRIHIPDRLSHILTPDQLAAVHAHERGHQHHHHVWKNFALACLFIRVSRRRIEEQEFEADDFAAQQVGAAMMASALRKLSDAPFDLLRADRLEQIAAIRQRALEASHGME